MSDSVWTANTESMLKTRESVVSLNNVNFTNNTGTLDTSYCMLCLMESSLVEVNDTRFVQNEGILVESNRSSLAVTNSAVQAHNGSIGRFGIDLAE